MKRTLIFSLLILVSFSFSYTYYNYWVEKNFNTNSYERVWTILNLSSTSSTSLYVYYGGSTDKSDGSKVFIWFDDFTNGYTKNVLLGGQNGWVAEYDGAYIYSVDGTEYGANATNRPGYYKTYSPAGNFLVEFYFYESMVSSTARNIWIFNSAGNERAYIYSNGGGWYWYDGSSHIFANVVSNEWHWWGFDISQSTSSVGFYRDRVLKANGNGRNSGDAAKFKWRWANTISGDVMKYILARKYDSSATITISYGTEEVGSWTIDGETYTKRRQITITTDKDLTDYQIDLNYTFFNDNKMTITDDPGTPPPNITKTSPNENETWNPILFRIELTSNHSFVFCQLNINGTTYNMTISNATVCEKSLNLDPGNYTYNFSGNVSYNPNGENQTFTLGNFNLTKKEPPITITKLSPNETEKFNPIKFSFQSNVTLISCYVNVSGTVYNMSKINATVCEKNISGFKIGSYNYFFTGEANDSGNLFNFSTGIYTLLLIRDTLTISKNSPKATDSVSPFYFEIEAPSTYNLTNTYVYIDGSPYSMSCSANICSKSISISAASFSFYFSGQAVWTGTGEIFNFTTTTYYKGTSTDYFEITNPTSYDISNFTIRIFSPYLKESYGTKLQFFDTDGKEFQYCYDMVGKECGTNLSDYIVVRIEKTILPSQTLKVLIGNEGSPSNGSNVFDFYDDFNDGVLPTWVECEGGTANCGESGGEFFARIGGHKAWINTTKLSNEYIFEAITSDTQIFRFNNSYGFFENTSGCFFSYPEQTQSVSCDSLVNFYFNTNNGTAILLQNSGYNFFSMQSKNFSDYFVIAESTPTTTSRVGLLKIRKINTEVNISFSCSGKRNFNDFSGNPTEVNKCWEREIGSFSPVNVLNNENLFLFKHSFSETNTSQSEDATALMIYGGNIICPELIVFSNATIYLNQSWFKKSSACDIKVKNSTSYFLYDFETDSWYLKPASLYSTNQQYQEEIIFFSSGGSGGSGIISSIPELPYYLVCFERDGVYYVKSKLTSSAFHDISAESNGTTIYHFNQTTDEFSVAINISNVTNILYKIDETERCRWENQANLLGISKFVTPSNKILNLIIGVPLYLFILAISTIIPFVLMFLFVVNDVIGLLEPSQVALLSIMTGIGSAFTNWQGERSTKMLIIFFVMASTYAILFYTIAGIQEDSVAQLSQNIEDMRAKFENFDLLSLVLTLPTFLVNLFVFLLTLPLFVFDFLAGVVMEINPLFGSFLQSFKTAFVAGLYAYLALKAYEVVSNRFRTI